MFRKPLTVHQTHKVSGADRKKLRRSVAAAFKLPDDSPALEALLPAKAGELTQGKAPAPSRLVIYLLDEVPVLLDTSGKGDLVPTVMGLWRCCAPPPAAAAAPTPASDGAAAGDEGAAGDSSSSGQPAAAPAAGGDGQQQQQALLPCISLKHWSVSPFIVGGADVMLPGVAPDSLPPAFNVGALMAVCVPGNPCPIAVGTVALNSQTAHAQAAVGGKGRLLEVVQHYGDSLWSGLGGGAVPNQGFKAGCVAPWPDGAAGDADAAAAVAAAQEGLGGLSVGDGSGPAAAGADAASDAAAAAPAAAAAAAATPAEMDALLQDSLLQALERSVKDGDLPLNSAVLWAQHLLPARPAGSTLDVKRSSYKKMSKFLQHFAKAGLLATREEKHSGDTLLTGVNRSHQLLQEFVPHKAAGSSGSSSTPAAGTAAAAAGAAGAGSSGGAAAPGGQQQQQQAELVIEEVWRPSKEVKGVFEAVGADPGGYYSAAAAGDVAFAYAKQQQLDARAPNETCLLLDPLLCDALYKGVLKKGQPFPTVVPKAELRAAFLARCSQQTRVSRGSKSVLQRGPPPAVCVSGERRQGNKFITRVTGLEAYLVDPASLAAEAQRLFACASTVAPLPGKTNPGMEVLIQGNLIEKLPGHLMAAHGIPKRCFLVKK